MRAGGPTRIGAISPNLAASTTPSIEILSHGCATAVVTGGSCWAACTSRSYRSRRSSDLVFIATFSSASSRCLIPADLRRWTGEHGLDAFEPATTLRWKGAARDKYPTHHPQRLLTFPTVV